MPLPAGLMIALILIGAGLAGLAYRVIGNSSHNPRLSLAAAAPESVPHLIREEGRITIPQDSALRSKLTVGAVGEKRDRLRGLTKIGGAPLKEQQQAETDYVTAEAEFQRAGARLKQIGVEAETTNKSRLVTIVAPMAGSVIDLAVAPGAYWNDATAALMTVADLSSVWVTANVPESDTAQITKGQQVEVVFASYPGEVFKGQVLFVSDVLDPDTRRTKVRIAFQNPDIRLKPGMFASVSFFTPKQTVPVVPLTALILKNDANVAFVEVEPWSFEPRPVEISFQQGNQAIVKRGLKAGDRVVVKGGVLLND